MMNGVALAPPASRKEEFNNKDHRPIDALVTGFPRKQSEQLVNIVEVLRSYRHNRPRHCYLCYM